MSKKSDTQVIYEAMVQNGYVTEDEARTLGCGRSLKQRIHDLRSKYGLNIETVMATRKKRRTGRKYQLCEKYILHPRKDKTGHKRPHLTWENLVRI